MLSGDRREVANRLGDQLGLDEVRAGLLPAEKVTAAGRLAAEHEAMKRGDMGLALSLSGTFHTAIAEIADRVVHMRSGEIVSVERNEHPKPPEEIVW